MLELSVVILTLNEAENLRYLLPRVNEELNSLNVSHEIVVVDGNSTDGTKKVAEQFGARCLIQPDPGYGAALRFGFSEAKGKYLLTLDADGSHPAELISELWQKRNEAELIIASRFTKGGSPGGPWIRRALSALLSLTLPKLLAIPATDLSSGYRLYLRSAVSPNRCTSPGFEILLELLVLLYADGYQLSEIPLNYRPRYKGNSHVHLWRFGKAYLKAAFRLWKQRNSVESADYDHRAYDSRIPLQKYWQMKRSSLTHGFLEKEPGAILDVGCGTSRIIQSLPNAVAADYSLKKLRYLKRTNRKRVLLSTFDLPFLSSQFDTLIHSQVIEHIPYTRKLFTEFNRVLKPNGTLIIGTPDYGRIWWPITEYFYGLLHPNAYADEHITHYTFASLTDHLRSVGFEILEHAYICGGELIVKARKYSELSQDFTEPAPPKTRD